MKSLLCRRENSKSGRGWSEVGEMTRSRLAQNKSGDKCGRKLGRGRSIVGAQSEQSRSGAKMGVVRKSEQNPGGARAKWRYKWKDNDNFWRDFEHAPSSTELKMANFCEHGDTCCQLPCSNSRSTSSPRYGMKSSKTNIIVNKCSDPCGQRSFFRCSKPWIY